MEAVAIHELTPDQRIEMIPLIVAVVAMLERLGDISEDPAKAAPDLLPYAIKICCVGTRIREKKIRKKWPPERILRTAEAVLKAFRNGSEKRFEMPGAKA